MKKKIMSNYPKKEKCYICKGTGLIQNDTWIVVWMPGRPRKCWFCLGMGYVMRDKDGYAHFDKKGEFKSV
jgi:hypothetical protein